MKLKFKKGDKVIIKTMGGGSETRLRGETGTVYALDVEDNRLPYGFKSTISGETRWCSELDLEPVNKSKLTKEEKELAKLKEQVAKKEKAITDKAKAAAERKKRAEAAKKKREAAKLLDSLPGAAKRTAIYLRENKDAFGCNRPHVIGVLAAMVGADLAKFTKAIEA